MKKTDKEPKVSDLISTGEAAKILDVTSQHVSYLVREGRIDAHKIGGRWLVVKDSVYRYMNER